MRNDIAKKSKRVQAGVIDLLIGFALLTLLGNIFGDTTIAGSQAGNFSIKLSGPSFYIGCIIVVLGSAYLEFKYGKTPGKYFCKIKVVSESDSHAISFKQSLIRNSLRFIDGIFFYLVGFIIMASNKTNQRLGDMVAKTLVVNDLNAVVSHPQSRD